MYVRTCRCVCRPPRHIIEGYVSLLCVRVCTHHRSFSNASVTTLSMNCDCTTQLIKVVYMYVQVYNTAVILKLVFFLY